MFSITAKRPGIAVLLHRPQQRPSGGNYSTDVPVREKKITVTALTALKTHVGHQEQRHAVPDVFPDFSRGECGSWLGPASCPGLSPSRTEGGCDWRSPGTPPVSIGTEAHRGSAEEGLRVWYLPPSPPSYPPHTTHGSGVSSYIYTLQLRKGYLSYERIWYNNLQIVQHRMHVEKINHPMANARGIASFGWRKHCMSDGNLHPMDFYSHPVCSNENIRLTLQMGLMCSNHKPLPLNTIKGARLPTSGHVELS